MLLFMIYFSFDYSNGVPSASTRLAFGYAWRSQTGIALRRPWSLKCQSWERKHNQGPVAAKPAFCGRTQ